MFPTELIFKNIDLMENAYGSIEFVAKFAGKKEWKSANTFNVDTLH